MEKINIAELLKDCPKGMGLDCTIYDNVEFEGISDNKDWPIKISVEGYPEVLNPYGCISYRDYTKCVIFPKGKTTWQGFVPPYKFKEGDVVISNFGDIHLLRTENSSYCAYRYGLKTKLDYFITTNIKVVRLATEEEKSKLFQAIKENGYRWNPETKTLEKVFPYNIGTKVWVKSDKEHEYIHTIIGISRNACGNLEYEVKEEKTGIFVHYPKELLIPITKEPQFKIGDIIQDKDGYKVKITEVNIEDECYRYESMIVKGIGGIAFKEQDDWKLVPNKFDINTLIPFESKVLVRHNKDNKWCGSFFSFIDRDIHSHCYKFVTTADKSYPMMIPYKGNEYLLGTTDDCNDFYKTWE